MLFCVREVIRKTSQSEKLLECIIKKKKQSKKDQSCYHRCYCCHLNLAVIPTFICYRHFYILEKVMDANLFIQY